MHFHLQLTKRRAEIPIVRSESTKICGFMMNLNMVLDLKGSNIFEDYFNQYHMQLHARSVGGCDLTFLSKGQEQMGQTFKVFKRLIAVIIILLIKLVYDYKETFTSSLQKSQICILWGVKSLMGFVLISCKLIISNFTYLILCRAYI